MADDELVERLLSGVEEWNRSVGSEALKGADLSGAKLSGANLREANLEGALLSNESPTVPIEGDAPMSSSRSV